MDFELKRAEVREAERVARETELQTELEAAKQDIGTYPQVWVCMAFIIEFMSSSCALFH